VDAIITEPLGGAHNDPAAAAAKVKSALLSHLGELLALSAPDRLRKRYEKFRAYGHYIEKPSAPAPA
jgi:acetyl-CoA carboxylase carboxyl transferase subunit alpha